MADAPAETAAPDPQLTLPEPYTEISPESGSRLDDLVARYEQAKAAYDAAAERYGEIRDAIKAELLEQADGATRLQLNSTYLTKPLRLVSREQWRLDTKTLKRQAPEVYVRFAVKSSTWYLETAR